VGISDSRSPPPARPPSITSSTAGSTRNGAHPPRGRSQSGQLSERQALVFAAVLGVSAMAILAFLVNLLTAC